MATNVITIGSKILDDIAIASRGKIVNQHRITDINPYSFCDMWCNEVSESDMNSLYEMMDFSNDYSRQMFELDFGRKIHEVLHKVEQPTMILYDLSVIRIPVRRFVFEDGRTIHVTENPTLKKNLVIIKDFLKNHIGKIIEDRVIDIFGMSDGELCNIVDGYEKLLLQNENARLYCVDVRLVSHYITKRNTVEILPNQNVIYNTNKFLKKIRCFHCERIPVIPVPEHIWGDEKVRPPQMFNYNNLCLSYFASSILDFAFQEEALKRYNIQEKIVFEEAMMKPLAFLTNAKYRNRKIVLIGESNALRYILAHDYGIEVSKAISYTENMSEDELLENLEGISHRDREFFCIIPHVYGNTVIRALWKCGYGYGIGYASILHNAYKLENFVGHYEDVFHNVIDSNFPVTIEIRGAGNNISLLNYNKAQANLRMVILSGINVCVEEDSYFGQDSSFILYDGAKLSIGKNTVMKKSCHIRGSFNTTTTIRDNVLINNKTILFNGDGHAIIDLHSGKNINYAYREGHEENYEINIESDCVVGRNTFVLSGTRLGEKSIVDDNSFVNKKFCEGSHIGGSPARTLE